MRDLIPVRQGHPDGGERLDIQISEGVAEYLHERLVAAQQCPPHTVERLVLIRVPEAFSVLLSEEDVRTMTPERPGATATCCETSCGHCPANWNPTKDKIDEPEPTRNPPPGAAGQ